MPASNPPEPFAFRVGRLLAQHGVGGYELGLAFPPDWVGNYVYEMTDTESQKILEPGTVVNFESQFYSPRMSGITYYIDTLMFTADKAYQPLASPLELVVVGE